MVLVFLALWSAGAAAQSLPLVVDAGPFQHFCNPVTVQIGGAPTANGGTAPYTYQWAPTTPLNTYTVSNPYASVTVTTTFTVTVRDGVGAIQKDTVTIRIYNYSIDAGADTTIHEGQTITLHGHAPGATGTFWQPPSGNIYNQNTPNPNVFPNSTMTYTLAAVYPGGCTLYDTVRVTVIPGSDLWFFNTFSPNGDGANDYFYIGNIEKYPNNVLEIYNRYGQKIFSETPYKNDWDGKYQTSELPAGTYYYLLDTKSDKGGKHHGSVTIVR